MLYTCLYFYTLPSGTLLRWLSICAAVSLAAVFRWWRSWWRWQWQCLGLLRCPALRVRVRSLRFVDPVPHWCITATIVRFGRCFVGCVSSVVTVIVVFDIGIGIRVSISLVVVPVIIFVPPVISQIPIIPITIFTTSSFPCITILTTITSTLLLLLLLLFS